MVKQVTFAVAGSGKTSTIVDRIEEDTRGLIITYTDNNTRHLKNKVIAKCGCIPTGVRIYSYFAFLYSFCYRPIFGAASGVPTQGMNFARTLPMKSARSKMTDKAHWFDDNDRLFSNRLAKLLGKLDEEGEVINRIDHFFDVICIDEVQDFAANDFNFLCSLINAKADLYLVGDFFQHTFDTSRDGTTNKSLYDDYNNYRSKLEKEGFEIDTESLTRSYRCSPTICRFVDQNLGINIQSHRQDEVELKLLEDENEIEEIAADNSVVKLFYQNSRSYKGNTDNWGNTKGLDDFRDVCVILNPKSLTAFNSGTMVDLPPTTKNKLYVACTRARRNLYFLPERSMEAFKK